MKITTTPYKFTRFKTEFEEPENNNSNNSIENVKLKEKKLNSFSDYNAIKLMGLDKITAKTSEIKLE